MRPTLDGQSQILPAEGKSAPFRGKHLTFLTNYVPTEPVSDLERATWDTFDWVMRGNISLADLFTWVSGTLARAKDTPDEYLPIMGVLATIASYRRIHAYGSSHELLYSTEEIYERIADLWDWMALGTNKLVVKEQEPMPTRVLSLVEEDMRAKIGEYLASRMVLEELVHWLNNPLLLWEMLEQAVIDPTFYEFAMSVHRICLFFTDSQNMREMEVYDLFSRLVFH